MTSEPAPSRRPKLIGAILLGATLVAGLLAGAAIDRALVQRSLIAGSRDSAPCGDRHRPHGMEAFEPLGLTPAQREQVQVILERRRTQMDAFWQEARPRLRAVVDSTETEIRALLSPEQQAAFDRMRAERREMMQKKHPEWKGVPDSAATHLDDTAPEER